MTRSAPVARPPSVERLLLAVHSRLDDPPPSHEALVELAREVLAIERMAIADGGQARSIEDLASEVVGRLGALERPALRRVINATGVIIHTNLGRAPWADAAIEAAAAAAKGYLFLELDPSTGRRAARFRVAEEHLIALTGAEDALVVNNNAAAVALAVGLAGRGGVAVSRGELVEIGGGVRIPEIVRRAGAKLIEVGTTNRTRVADFAEALADGRAKVVLRVHPSNFRQSGFVESPDSRALADAAHEHGAPLVDDLGSGALMETATYGLAHEPTPREALGAGADLVTFSGDKLLGGPQAGLIVGRGELVGRLRRDPLTRATRPDKVTLAALAATLGLYRAGRAATEIPVWRMIAANPRHVRARAEAMVLELGNGVDIAGLTVTELEATVGGGSLPGEVLPSAGLALEARGARAERLLAALRSGEPPVVARVESRFVVLDLRTVDPADDAAVATALGAAIARADRPRGGRPATASR